MGDTISGDYGMYGGEGKYKHGFYGDTLKKKKKRSFKDTDAGGRITIK